MNSPPPRWLPELPLPPYSYVPGRFPHPQSDPNGHSYGRHDPSSNDPLNDPLSDADWTRCRAYLRGIDLFHHGFYWEAHESWEAAWHAAGRQGPIADLLKGLIKLAAAGVKTREGRPRGVVQHARRAAELLRQSQAARPSAAGSFCGLDLDRLAIACQRIADEAESQGVRAGRVNTTDEPAATDLSARLAELRLVEP